MRMRALNPVVALGLVAFATVSAAAGPVRADPPSPASTAPPAAPSPPTAPPDPSVKRSTVALASAGVAVVGAGVATVFGVLALKNKRDYERGPTFSNTDDGNDDAAYADGGIALAVAAGITSLVLFLTSDPADARPAGSTPPPRAGAASPANAFVLRF